MLEISHGAQRESQHEIQHKCVEGSVIMEKIEPLKGWSPEEIREAIKAKGLSIENLAEEWGEPTNAVYAAISGPFYWELKELIANYLGEKLETIWTELVARRQEKAERRARSLLEARAVAASRVA